MKNIYMMIVLAITFTSFANASESFKFEKMNDNVYVMHGPVEEPNEANKGFMNNPAAIIAKNGVIIVDPGGSLYAGSLVINGLKEITKKPIIAVFNTHIHGDHWLANKVIKEFYPKAVIYAHSLMIKRAKAGFATKWIKMVENLTNGATKGMTPVYPSEETSNLEKINIDDQTFIIHNPTEKAHTNTDIMIEHVNTKTMFLGDNCFLGRFGNFDGTSNIHKNIEVLNYAISKNMKLYVPGHGRSGDVKTTIIPFLSYMKILKDVVQKGYSDDMESFEIKKDAIKALEQYKSWDAFDTRIGKHVAKMYEEIEALDE